MTSDQSQQFVRSERQVVPPPRNMLVRPHKYEALAIGRTGSFLPGIDHFKWDTALARRKFERSDIHRIIEAQEGKAASQCIIQRPAILEPEMRHPAPGHGRLHEL